MQFVFVVGIKHPTGKKSHYAHMILGETLSEAEKRIRAGFSPESTGAILENVTFIGKHDEKEIKRKSHWDIYDKACEKAAELDKERVQPIAQVDKPAVVSV